jgi:hypothetical protein
MSILQAQGSTEVIPSHYRTNARSEFDRGLTAETHSLTATPPRLSLQQAAPHPSRFHPPTRPTQPPNPKHPPHPHQSLPPATRSIPPPPGRPAPPAPSSAAAASPPSTRQTRSPTRGRWSGLPCVRGGLSARPPSGLDRLCWTAFGCPGHPHTTAHTLSFTPSLSLSSSHSLTDPPTSHYPPLTRPPLFSHRSVHNTSQTFDVGVYTKDIGDSPCNSPAGKDLAWCRQCE